MKIVIGKKSNQKKVEKPNDQFRILKKFIHDAVSKDYIKSEDNSKNEKMIDLLNSIKDILNQSVEILKSEKRKVRAMCFDKSRKRLYVGFEKEETSKNQANYQIAYTKIDKINDEDSQTQEAHIDLKYNDTVEDLFVLENTLIVVFKTSVNLVDLTQNLGMSSNQRVFFREICAKKDTVIKDAFFSEIHKSLYVMLHKKDEEHTIFGKLDIFSDSDCKIQLIEVAIRVDRFEVSSKDPLILFLICRDQVFKCSMPDGNAMTKFKRQSNESVFEYSLEEDFSNVNSVEPTPFLQNMTGPISYFKFDRKMENFYTNEKYFIKKCDFESQKEKQSMSSRRVKIKNLWFSQDFSSMFRYTSLPFNPKRRSARQNPRLEHEYRRAGVSAQ